MARKKHNQLGLLLERFSHQATVKTGSSLAFVLAVTVVVFLMVFLIQRAQNKDALAIHLKLNEIVAAMQGASNRLIDVEDLSETEIEALRKYYRKLIELARTDDNLTATHSV